MDHGEEVIGQFVVASGDAAEVLEFGEEPLDQVAFAIEPLAESETSAKEKNELFLTGIDTLRHHDGSSDAA